MTRPDKRGAARRRDTASVTTPQMLTEGGPTRLCHNLRPDRSGALRPAGRPAVITGCGSWRPLAASPLPGGQWVMVMADGNRLGFLTDDEVREIATLPSEPRCVAFDGASATVMTDSGPWRIIFTDDGAAATIAGMPASLPGLHFAAVARGQITVRGGSMEFAWPYPRWGGELTGTDRRNLSAAMLSGYGEAARQAASAGRFIQPIAVRYKLRDSAGRLLMTGPTTIVAPAGGWQGMEATTARSYRSGDDGMFHSLGAWSMPVNAFELAVDLPGAEGLRDEAVRRLASRVASAEICVLPPVHPVNYQALAEYRMESGEGETGVLRIFMPGCTADMLPQREAMSRRMAAVPSLMERNEITVATLDNPFAGEMRRVLLPRPQVAELMRSAADDNTAFNRMSRAVAPAGPDEVRRMRLNAPHGFAARCACTSGSGVVWGDITRIPFEGYDLDSLSTGDGEADIVRASVRVTLTGAEGGSVSVVRNHIALTASATLSPLLSYPDPAARRMEIRIEMRDGTVGSADIALSPGADGLHAYALSANLEPVVITPRGGVRFVPFESQESRELLSGYVASTLRSEPLSILSAAECAGGRVAQIIPAWGANASWDYASGRFYLMSASGIIGLSTGRDGRSLRASLIDPRPAVYSHGAAMTSSGVVALADGDLIRLCGTKATTLIKGTDASATGYDSSREEVWIAGNRRVTVYDLRTGSHSTRTAGEISGMVAAGGSLIIKRGDELLNTRLEQSGAMTEIEWEGEAEGCPWQPETLLAEITASMIKGEVTLSDGTRTITRLSIDGPHHHPVAMRMAGPSRLHHYIAIRGTVSSDFRLGPIQIR